MARLIPLALLLLLFPALLGSSCGDEQAVSLEELRRDVAPPFDYALYCDSQGQLVGERSAVLLVYRSSHLERVFADAQAGDSRAQALFSQLEHSVQASGSLLAQRASSMVCHSAPSCSVQYWERRYEHLASPAARPELKPPLTWESYASLLGRYQRALEFQRSVTRALQQEALAPGQRTWLRGLEQPVVAENVGLAREGSSSIVYVDQFVVDQATLRPGLKPSVHSFSTKQHGFASMNENQVRSQLKLDIAEAQAKYGGSVEVRRPGHPLFGRKVVVSQVHLVYDGTGLSPTLRKSLSTEASARGVTLHLHVP